MYNISFGITAFLDKEVNELCEILDDYKVTADRDMPEEFWNRFLNSIISTGALIDSKCRNTTAGVRNKASLV